MTSTPNTIAGHPVVSREEWLKLDAPYELSGPDGPASLADLFGNWVRLRDRYKD